MSDVTGIRGRSAVAGRRSTSLPGIGSPWLRFWAVGLSGIVVNQILLLVLTEGAGIFYLASAVLATLGSSTWNYAWADRWVFVGRPTQRSAVVRYASFLALNLAVQPIRLPILWGLTELGGLHYGLANLVSLAVLTIGRTVVADRWIWARPTAAHADTASLKHHYAIDELVRIASAVRLPELETFRVAAPTAPPDVVIRVGWVAPRPTRRVRFERDGERLVYREQLGALGGNFSLHMGDPIEIVVTPLLGMSPHVVYTNIVEAFLRFLLVSRGYVLLHAACVADENGAMLISAQTDTGKTSTVISLVRKMGYRFLSDDMTIVTPSGDAVSYPKPMTLSFHTLAAARGGRMTVRERLALSIQSRLHSKTGRQVGRALGSGTLPIMTMNAIVQALVPPPKYAIDRLFPCRVGGRARIAGVTLIERGDAASLERLDHAAALQVLVENTDDAYGFPPFSTFAPQIRVGDQDYERLRATERQLIGQIIAGIDRWQLRDPERSWASRIPELMDPRTAADGQVPIWQVAEDGPVASGERRVATGPAVGVRPAPVAAGPVRAHGSAGMAMGPGVPGTLPAPAAVAAMSVTLMGDGVMDQVGAGTDA